MNTALEIALMGGFLGILTLIHFVVDWVFQTHAEAVVKHNNPRVRAKHCLIYTAGFVPFMMALQFTPMQWVLGLNILFWSHFTEDTYVPVYLWAKYIRKPLEMQETYTTVYDLGDLSKTGYTELDPKAGFVKFIGTPLGKILMIVIDQIIHLLFLLPIAWFAMQHIGFIMVLPAN